MSFPGSVTVTVRVFIGGKGGTQAKHFLSAQSNIEAESPKDVVFEKVDTEDVRKRYWSPKELIDWLCGGDIHITLSHLHQGFDPLCWDIQELWQHYSRLRDHIGYIGGADDPIFLQDKIRYLLALDRDDYLPTFKIDLPKFHEGRFITSKALMDDLNAFLTDTKTFAGAQGWVVKTACTTHGSPYRGSRKIFCHDEYAVYERIVAISKLAHQVTGTNEKVIRIPYMFVQPRLVHNREYKIIVLNHKAKMIVRSKEGTGPAFKSTPKSIFEFCEKVVQKLKTSWPETATDFFIRVDLFEVDGKLKVNEFESFEANYLAENDVTTSSKRKRMEEVCYWSTYHTEIYLEAFWYRKVKELMIMVKGLHHVATERL